MRLTMIRRIFLIGAAALSLSACGGNLLGPPDAGAIYPVRPTFTAPASGMPVNWSLAILRPTVPGGLDSDRIALLQPDGSMDYYAKASLPDRAPNIIQSALLEGFESSQRIAAVAREQDALHADYNLVVEVKDFEAKYATPDGIPQAVVVMSAKLVTFHGRRIVATFIASQSVSATANSAGAAAQALSQALGNGVTQIVGWALAAPPPPVADADGSPGKPAEQLLHDVMRGSNTLRPNGPGTPQ
jgi:cholesterol transport system auxiliary component